MFLFIDESGDPGYRGSATKYFVVAAVIFNTEEDLQLAETVIGEYKQNINLKTEIHFVKIDNKRKECFFSCIKKLNFKVKAIYFEKTCHDEDIYNKLLCRLLENLQNSRIRVDGKKDKKEQKIKNNLRKNSIKIKQFKVRDSREDCLLQMADMIASAIGHNLNKNNSIWFDLFRDRVEIIEFK